ncbi:hypothetical protein CIMIT_08815 [Corynebacterium imitans]|uniref:Uncharacterized protein n=1 Tax=Corynebacterium imitans TaxID=156978 RepID=A0A076NHP9_9CORY|nr:hypothetical protein CIMIT_08815 [Corynebacterium imitans]
MLTDRVFEYFVIYCIWDFTDFTAVYASQFYCFCKGTTYSDHRIGIIRKLGLLLSYPFIFI